ncbi:hypothetical protein SAMN02745674_00278 [Lysobacter spongiicola DSM 21749]|uniref:Uncharacterized protein n=1 Tax=Lysobacter spongiicola DSM 21749 TaxID=1122188 RepID=A0A1T4M4D5_9GAMM|nr:hypothetical protein SAMN02745674_00278 [Lysobacter spongiicola DSM 21749]
MFPADCMIVFSRRWGGHGADHGQVLHMHLRGRHRESRSIEDQGDANQYTQ